MKNYLQRCIERVNSQSRVISFLFFFSIIVHGQNVNATIYYSQGSIDPGNTASWSINRSGGGTPLSSFTAGDVFVIQNAHNMTTTALWSISGTGSKLWIESGGTLTATFAVTLAVATTFQIDANGTYIHSNTAGYSSTIFQAGTKSFNAASTVILNKSFTTGPANVVFGNLTVNFTSDPGGAVNLSGAITTINGNLTIQSTFTREFRLTGNTALNLTIAKDLIISGGTLNLVSGTGAPTINIGGDFNHTLGTFSSSGSVSTIIFTGGVNTNVALTEIGTFTGTNINWQVSALKSLTLNTGLPVATSRNFTVNGTLICGNSIISGAGLFNLSANATLSVGSASGVSGNISVTGVKTFDNAANYIFSGSTQSSGFFSDPKTMNNLTISGSGTKVLLQAINVNGTLKLNAGIFDNSVKTLSMSDGSAVNRVEGNLVSNPVYGNLTGVNVLYTGANTIVNAANSTRELTPVSGKVNDVTVNLSDNSKTVNSSTSSVITVNGNLTLSSGTLSGGNDISVLGTLALGTQVLHMIVPNKIFANTVSRTSGWVNGVLQKSVVNGINNFEIGSASVYAPSYVNMLNVSGGPVLIAGKVTAGPIGVAGSPLHLTKKCDHYWTFTKSGAGTFDKYSASFTISGTSNTGVTSAYKVAKFDSPSTWSTASGSESSGIVTSGLYTSFSDFEVGEIPCILPSSPLASNDGPQYPGTTIHLTSSALGSAPLTYNWTGAGTLSSLTAQNPDILNPSTNAGGVYTVTITNECGSTSATTNVLVTNLSWNAIASSGNNQTAGGLSQSYTLGESIIADYVQGASECSQGFQQSEISFLQMRMFIQGFYTGGGFMNAVVDPINEPLITDTVSISFIKTDLDPSPAFEKRVILHTNGWCSLQLPGFLFGHSYYLKLNHRNSLETWSRLPLQLSTFNNYDFTSP
jgi:hypothetical protein